MTSQEHGHVCLSSFSSRDDVISEDASDDESLPKGLPEVIDAHVHLFPDRVFDAIWRWFGEHGWPIRYTLYAQEVINFLQTRGVSKMVGLTYAHVPEMARSLNVFMSQLCEQNKNVAGLGTVLPGEKEAEHIVNEAFALGLRGLKLHCHVQDFAIDHEALDVVFNACVKHNKTIVVHAGREPKSEAYKSNTHKICNASRTESVLRRYPELKLVVPHLGADEYDDYARLLERYPNLMLDSTMVLAHYFIGEDPFWMLRRFPKRVMYGTDFPNLPYAWNREIKRLAASTIGQETLALLLSKNAERTFFERDE